MRLRFVPVLTVLCWLGATAAPAADFDDHHEGYYYPVPGQVEA